MLRQIEQEQIKRLIEKGFDLELISFELDIPIEQIKLCQQELKNHVSKRKTEYTKMAQMRENYKKLSGMVYEAPTKLHKHLFDEDIEIIENVIEKIKEDIKEIQKLSGKERRNIGVNILDELKKIKEYELTIEQAEELTYLMNSKEIHGIGIVMDDRIDYHLNEARKKVEAKLADAIFTEQSKTKNVQKLKELMRKITTKMVEENQSHVGTIKNVISSRIHSLEQSKIMYRLKNDFSKNIDLVITSLASGEIDMKKAKRVIEKEAKERIKDKPKTKFGLTEEQEKRQILIQISTAIKENSDKYSVENPEKTILQLHELCGGTLEQSLTAVVRNLIGRTEYKEAKRICDEYSTKKESQMINQIWRLKSEIRNAEISDFVLKGINMHGTVEEEKEYFELIEKGLRKGKVDLKSISLGKSKDGLKNISLADIWPDENKKQNLGNTIR